MSLKTKFALDNTKLGSYIGKSILTIFSFFILMSLIGTFHALGYGPNNPECFEQPDQEGCPSFFDAPFDRMLDPFNAVFQDFTFVVIWAIIVGILWLRVSNTMMVAVFGVVLAALFTRPDPANPTVLTGFSTEAQAVGWGLLILAVVVAIYQILQVRVHFPTN